MSITIEINPGDVQDRVVVVLEGTDFSVKQADVGINMSSREPDIMRIMSGIIREEKGVNISGEYKVRKALDSRTIYIIPNSTAG